MFLLALLDDVMTTKQQKHTISTELVNLLANQEFRLDIVSTQPTAIIVDFMAMIRKVQFTEHFRWKF